MTKLSRKASAGPEAGASAASGAGLAALSASALSGSAAGAGGMLKKRSVCTAGSVAGSVAGSGAGSSKSAVSFAASSNRENWSAETLLTGAPSSAACTRSFSIT